LGIKVAKWLIPYRSCTYPIWLDQVNKEVSTELQNLN
jgi:hypothetical protein